MIEAFIADTSNGQRLAIALREMELQHTLRYINLWRGEHKADEYLSLNPAGLIPTIIADEDPDARLVLTETTAILIYLAEKCDRFLPAAGAERARVLEWLMFQTTNLTAPKAQAAWLKRSSSSGSAPFEPAISALRDRTLSYYRILDTHLSISRYIAGETYSIADIMAYPMAASFAHPQFGSLENVARWLAEVGKREAVSAAVTALKKLHADTVARTASKNETAD